MTREDVSSFARVAFIDIEASGLGSSSFPTELGWAMVDEDGSVESSSRLIKPPSQWTIYANAWDPASERLTGITREMLERDGVAPSEAMRRFLTAVGDRAVFSDAPDFDGHWLSMIAKAAATQAPEIGHSGSLIEMSEVGISSHRAEPDARRLAIAYVATLTDAQ